MARLTYWQRKMVGAWLRRLKYWALEQGKQSGSTETDAGMYYLGVQMRAQELLGTGPMDTPWLKKPGALGKLDVDIALDRFVNEGVEPSFDFKSQFLPPGPTRAERQ